MEQNTDRMWWTIGVIVLGALLIGGGSVLANESILPKISQAFVKMIDGKDTINPDDEVPYDEWLKDLENKGYVVAKDDDFSGEADGKFIYIGTDEKVIVPEIIKGVTITSAKNMFSNNTQVKAVAVNNPNLIDMSYMFAYNQLTSLDVSNLVTENVWNMKGMFRGSQSTSLDISGFDTSNVTNMAYMFEDCQSTILDVSKWNTSNVTNMRNMFPGSRATSLDLSNFDTSKVTDMYEMFANSRATSLDLSSFDTSKVTDMAYMFANTLPTSLDLSNFDTSNVSSMGGMFYYSQATELDLSSFDTSKVTNMGWMFYYSQATTGYAKTDADATKFNTSYDKPTSLIFVVK